MNARIAAQTVMVSREQAENLAHYPELLARMVEMVSTALHQRVADLTGHPDEFITVMIAAEVRFLTEDGDQE